MPTSVWSLFARETVEPSKGGKANDSGLVHWCVLRQNVRLGSHSLAQRQARCQEATVTYCKGNPSRKTRQGKGLAVAAHPLARGQIAGGPASDWKQRCQNTGYR